METTRSATTHLDRDRLTVYYCMYINAFDNYYSLKKKDVYKEYKFYSLGVHRDIYSLGLVVSLDLADDCADKFFDLNSDVKTAKDLIAKLLESLAQVKDPQF
jgi:hypothetical protein